MRIFDLTEGRRGGPLNTKARNSQGIKDLLAYAEQGSMFASFTNLPKLGINPSSKYDTPIGIYAYPLDSQAIQEEIEGDFLPFAGKAPYINVFRLSAGNDEVVELNASAERFKDLNTKTANWLARRITIIGSNGELSMEGKLQQIWQEVFFVAAQEAYYKNPAGIWWNFTRMCALMSKYAEGRDIEADEFGSHVKAAPTVAGGHATRWTRLMLDIGVKAVIDINGDGIIHTNEPTQAVFFSTTAFKMVDRLFNPRQEFKDALEVTNANSFAKLLRLTPKTNEPYALFCVLEAIAAREEYESMWSILHPYTFKKDTMPVIVDIMSDSDAAKCFALMASYINSVTARKSIFVNRLVTSISHCITKQSSHTVDMLMKLFLDIETPQNVAAYVWPIFAKWSPDGPAGDPAEDNEYLAFLHQYGLVYSPRP